MLCQAFYLIIIAALPAFLRRVKLLLILLLPVICNAQKISGPIVLSVPQFLLPVTEFYVAGVVDSREGQTPVALLVSPQATAPGYILDLQGGALTAVKQYFDKSIVCNKALRPVIIHIKKIRVDESLQHNGRIEGKVAVVLSFWLKKEGNDLQLIDYPGGASYNRSNNQQVDIGGLLSNSLQAGLVYFNNWINKQADGNIKLAKGVKLIFSDYTEKPEGDTIYYSDKRPLKWDDFRQKPPASKYAAEVFPSISYGEQVAVIKGIIQVRISLKPYLPKSACWVRDGSRNPYSLNHEQRHFDIVKLVMEHFKQRLQNEKLTADNYDGPINVNYLDSFSEMNEIQKNYDNETNHGLNTDAQKEWNKKIDKELRP